jgi:hypothetical protein
LSENIFCGHCGARMTITTNGKKYHRKDGEVTIMPAFDPDAEITALTLTVPSWESSIRRTRSNTDFDSISNHAKGKLTEALINLRYTISMMLSTIKGEE